ncbi:F0F1 ATP synthase subunit epsilon [Pseudogemmobacter faecipullorum]|uniref:ATP synthase epsilon chain n=1 Tax=Pseudogemmobacter faecipullorum TaxID=2755041 RepID=A0ABS8CHU8_9RHOB|nr:F0F1 ATP synthase subunit epsilon [Pseudogemmobacter faecipullorum]MCB5408962.1 F0F1 ATP synthase subunit epsilon [Pseudogemmobacter faecipullorum]
MAGNLQFDLVSPERKLASVAATEVQLPASAGDMTAMAGHTPTITTLRPGLLRATTAEGVKSFVVIGGFADISAASVTVLAELAIPAAEADSAVFDTLIAEARARAEAASGADKAEAEKALSDVIALRDQVQKH